METTNIPELTIKIDLNSINFILEILSDRPYKEVAWLINTISTQANEQIDTLNQEVDSNYDDQFSEETDVVN